ncbi:MAG: zinc-ribbon domain-containing protein [Candidatus Babeliales bacterium]
MKNNKRYLIETHPEIAQEWHPDKNGELTPYDVTAGSNKYVWWICEKGHEYRTKWFLCLPDDLFTV